MHQLLNRLFARSTFNSAEELDQFAKQVIQKLHHAELHDAAMVLEFWHSTAYTTSSEYLGDLGLAIRKIQKQYKIDKDINADLNRLLRQVHTVWNKL